MTKTRFRIRIISSHIVRKTQIHYNRFTDLTRKQVSWKKPSMRVREILQTQRHNLFALNRLEDNEPVVYHFHSFVRFS